MKVLFIGLGSIAQKHIRAIQTVRPKAELLALRSGMSDVQVDGVKNIYTWADIPRDVSFILICNPTSEHYKTIEKAIEVGVPLFIEKPPLMSLNGADRLLDRIDQNGIRTYTAFNFRFHPVIDWLKNHLKKDRVLEVQSYCGSYLPEWRPNRDYREVYSAKKELGGGVHLDLIHEIDYIFWLFGKPEKVKGFLSKVSSLEIDSMDAAHYYLEYKHCIVAITVNYYRRDPKRTLEMVMEDDTWVADLLHNEIWSINGNLIYQSDVPVIETYTEQMKYFIETFESGRPFSNSLHESLETLKHALA